MYCAQAQLVGANRERILEMIKEFTPKGKQRNVFGNGNASKRIAEIIVDTMNMKSVIIIFEIITESEE